MSFFEEIALPNQALHNLNDCLNGYGDRDLDELDADDVLDCYELVERSLTGELPDNLRVWPDDDDPQWDWPDIPAPIRVGSGARLARRKVAEVVGA